MLTPFYLATAVALVATVMVITRRDAMHALLYLVVSFLALAVVFYLLGAPFIGALEVIVYAGAIIVLFVFAVMLLNLGRAATEQERRWLSPSMWIGPTILGTVLVAEVAYLLAGVHEPAGAAAVSPKEVSMTLFGPYLVGVELASILLLAGLVAAYHVGRRPHEPRGNP
jgi:NADH-quinone oxidoreductase subunit J